MPPLTLPPFTPTTRANQKRNELVRVRRCRSHCQTEAVRLLLVRRLLCDNCCAVQKTLILLPVVNKVNCQKNCNHHFKKLMLGVLALRKLMRSNERLTLKTLLWWLLYSIKYKLIMNKPGTRVIYPSPFSTI